MITGPAKIAPKMATLSFWKKSAYKVLQIFSIKLAFLYIEMSSNIPKIGTVLIFCMKVESH